MEFRLGNFITINVFIQTFPNRILESKTLIIGLVGQSCLVHHKGTRALVGIIQRPRVYIGDLKGPELRLYMCFVVYICTKPK